MCQLFEFNVFFLFLYFIQKYKKIIQRYGYVVLMFVCAVNMSGLVRFIVLF